MLEYNLIEIQNCLTRSKKLTCVSQGQVVQSQISTNPWLKFNPLFKFLYFYTSVYLKSSGPKTTVDADNNSDDIFPNS